MDEHILVLGGSQSLGQLITYRMLLVCGPMNSFSFSTQLHPTISEQLHEATIILTYKTLLIKISVHVRMATMLSSYYQAAD